MILVQLVLLVDAAGNVIRPVVEQIVMQLPVAAAKLLLLEEQCIVHEGQGIENVKVVPLGHDEGVVDEAVEARLESGLVKWLLQARLGGVVEEVGDTQDVVLRVVDD